MNNILSLAEVKLYSFIILVQAQENTHITIQLHKTEINRKTKNNQRK